MKNFVLCVTFLERSRRKRKMQRDGLCGQIDVLRRRPEELGGRFVGDLEEDQEDQMDEEDTLVLDWNSTSKFRKRFLFNPNLYSGGG